MSNLQEYESREEPEKSDEELLQMIRNEFEDFEWTVEGLKDRKKGTIPLPDESKVVTTLVEYKAIKILEEFCDENGVSLIPADNSRQYPDTTLTGGIFGDFKVALDMKTARVKDNGRASSMTLGSYRSYFRNPEKDTQYSKFPYGMFDRHWILAFLYEWNEDADTIDMVNIKEVIVQPKWQIASKASGSGTTNNIGGVNNIQDLIDGDGAFESEEEFEEYWRNYGTD